MSTLLGAKKIASKDVTQGTLFLDVSRRVSTDE